MGDGLSNVNLGEEMKIGVEMKCDYERTEMRNHFLIKSQKNTKSFDHQGVNKHLSKESIENNEKEYDDLIHSLPLIGFFIVSIGIGCVIMILKKEKRIKREREK